MNAMWLYYYVFILCSFRVVKTFPLNEKFATPESEKLTMKMILRDKLQSTTLSTTEGIRNVVTPNLKKIRIKRQSGAGKFVEAAKMPQIKLVRLILQMFKNTWDEAYIGGSHPFHPNVPKAIVELYKQRIVEFFIPDIEQSKT